MQLRWTDWTALNDSEFDFDVFDFLDQPISQHTLVDSSYTGVSVGLGYRVGEYQIDLFAGTSRTKDIDVAPGTNPFPGTYSMHDGNSFGIQITRVWGSR
jgi:hypothetical protein